MSALGRMIGMLWLAMVVTLSPATAQTFPPMAGQPVVDQANIIPEPQEADLNRKLLDFEKRSGRQLVVATVKSLEGYDPNDYATRLGREWKIGDEQKDDGVVFLVAPNERKVYIATGYGADDYLTDAMTGLIIREQVLPRFKAGDFPGGIDAGTNSVIEQLELPPEEAAKRAQAAGQRSSGRGGEGFSIFPIVVIVFVFFMIIGGISRAVGGGRRYRGKGGKRGKGGIDPMVVLWGLEVLSHAASRGSGGSGGWGGGGGGFGGGGFSGGGGSFGGGGAGGSW